MRQHLSKFKKNSIVQSKKMFALLLILCSATSIMAKVASSSLLTNGAVIRIYPYSHYGDVNLSLACNGDGKELTSYEKAGSGNEWTLEYAGYGCYYLKNELGCYWGNQGRESQKSLICTTDKDKAERVSFMDSANGIIFWNDTEGIALNNLMGNNICYNWWSTQENYNNDSNTTFEIMLIKQGDAKTHATKEIEDNGLRFLVDCDFKTGKLLPNDYTGDIVVPHYVRYEGQDYEITSANLDYFKNCTSFDARYINYNQVSNISENIKSFAVGNVETIEAYALRDHNNLISISFGDVGTIKEYAFAWCSNLQSASFRNVEAIGEFAFYFCYNLNAFTFPSTLKKVGDNAFERGVTFKCYVKSPEELSISNNFGYCVKEFYVPKSSLDDYKNTIPWNSFADKIFPMPDVIVTKIEMPATATIKTKGEVGRITLTAAVYPEDAENKTLKWSSSDENIATVDDMGNVTGVKAGDAIITAEATDGSGITATCTVSVEPTKIDNVSFFGIPSRLGVGEYVSDIKSKVIINPVDADYTDITIETSNPDILRYYNTDRLFGKTDGYATVTAIVTAFDGTTETTSIDITVGDPTSINETTSEELAAKCLDKRLIITGISQNEDITIEDAAGLTIYKGMSHEVMLPISGIYFVKAKGNTIKIYAK